METDWIKRTVWVLLLLFVLVMEAPGARASGTAAQDGQAVLPGSEIWQPYLDETPVSMQEFMQDPLEAIKQLLPGDLLETVQKSVQSYAQLFLFLLLVMLVSFLTGSEKTELLDLAAAGGSSILCWTTLAALSENVCNQLENWRIFLLGFVPVYEGVLTAGGEITAATAAGGLFLSGLCLLTQALGSWVPPLFHCYLALSTACCISTEAALAVVCRSMGQFFQKCLRWAGRAFGAILGLQRVFTCQFDSASQQLGRLLTGTVPIVGQSLSDAAGTVLSGIQLLKSGLGFAAIAFLTAEFLPVYMILMVHAVLLFGCKLLCNVAGIKRCAALFDCLREAVQGLAAAIAMVFGIAVLGTALLFMVGGG